MQSRNSLICAHLSAYKPTCPHCSFSLPTSCVCCRIIPQSLAFPFSEPPLSGPYLWVSRAAFPLIHFRSLHSRTSLRGVCFSHSLAFFSLLSPLKPSHLPGKSPQGLQWTPSFTPSDTFQSCLWPRSTVSNDMLGGDLQTTLWEAPLRPSVTSMAWPRS